MGGVPVTTRNIPCAGGLGRASPLGLGRPQHPRSGCPIFYQPSGGLGSPGIGADPLQVGRWAAATPGRGGFWVATRGIPP